MPPRKAVHAYDSTTAQMLQKIALPEKVKCYRCNKCKNHASFSNKQLLDARYAIKQGGPKANYKIKCVPCAGHQIHEIECCMCLKTKGLEDFAKSQRTKPDNAECMACVDSRLAREAVEEEKYEDPREAFEPIDNSGGNYPKYWGQSTLASAASETGTRDDAGSNADSDGGGIPLANGFGGLSLGTPLASSNTGSLVDIPYGGPVQNQSSWHSAKSATQPSSSGFNANAYGSPGSRPTSSVTGTSKTFASTATERTETKGGWAKIKACKSKPVQQVQGEEWKSDSESDDDAGDDDSDDDIEI